MDVLIKTATGDVLETTSGVWDRVNVPGTKDICFCGMDRPVDIGPNHFLADVTYSQEPQSQAKIFGPLNITVDTTAKTAVVVKTVIDKPMAQFRAEKYLEANAMHLDRGISLLDLNPRGSRKDTVLSAATMKEMQRDGPKAASLATLHDNLEALKELIDAADDQDALQAISTNNNSHWT